MDFDGYDFHSASGSWSARDFVHGRPRAPQRQLLTRDGYGTVIDSRTNTSAGVTIAPGATVAHGSHVVVDLATVNGLYCNDPHPYATLQRELDPGDPHFMEIPAELEPRQIDPELPARYRPHHQSPPARP